MELDELERELREGRPQPRMDFARELDDWAAAGFPSDRGLGPRAGAAANPLQSAWERIRAIPPRRLMLVPAGAVATVVVIAGVVVSQGDRGSDLSAPAPPQAQEAAGVQAGDSAVGADDSASSTEAASPAITDENSLSVPDADRGIAAGSDERIVDATARMTLGAEANDVQDVANEVVAVTDRYDGVVLDSQVTSDQGGARASFELELPYKQLDAALTDLSGLADVISRTEGGQDITAQAVQARRDLARALEQVREARIELIRADTRQQRLVIKARIDSLQASADASEAQLNSVERRGRFATVNVDVTSNGPDSDDGAWGIGDAFDDAGQVLEVIGGVALITLAIVLPLGLVVALIAFAIARGRRRARESALGA